MSMSRFLVVLAVVVLPAFSADPPEIIEIPCAEHERLTGQTICDLRSTMKWPKARYEAALRHEKIEKCTEAVLEKYAAYITRDSDGSGWGPREKPDHIAEKDWISCGPVRIWSGDESHVCFDELQACEARHAPPPKKETKPKKKVKLF